MTGTQKNMMGRLLQPHGKGRMIAALLVLFTGTALLLLSILAWCNFDALLTGDHHDKSAESTYLVIGKLITDRNMTGANYFSDEELKSLIQAPQVQDAGAVIPAQFPVYATIGSGAMVMSTDMPVACVPDRFIDNLPDNWAWQPGNRNLPVILSSQFLDIYNYVFAPGQGLPQLSRASVKAIALKLQAGGGEGMTLTAYVAGFTDRINTLLVPQSFVEYGNTRYAAGMGAQQPSQLILKVKDPSDTKFTAYLQAHGYTTSPQQLQWSRMRAIVEVVTSATGALALLIMGISSLVFILFTELTIARSRESHMLLYQLGYSTQRLRSMVVSRFLPPVFTVMIVSMVLCCGVQFCISRSAAVAGLELPAIPGWQYWAAWLVCLLLLWGLLIRAVKKALRHHAV